MSSRHLSAFFLFIFLILNSCTPKVTEEIQNPTPPPPPKVDENLSKCPKFSDAKNGDDLESQYVIYRDFLKLKKFDASFDMWKDVYDNAPAADGKRWTVYSDGIRYYEYFLGKETDADKKEAIIDNILGLYDDIAQCYPTQASYVKARKAFDYYYKYPNRKTEEEKYEMFKEVVESEQLDMPVFVVNPFTKLMVDRFLDDKISEIDAQKFATLIPERIEKGLLSGKELKQWAIVNEWANPYLERLESKKGFYDCDYYMDKYYPVYENDPTNCDEALSVYSKLRYGSCDKEDPILKAIYQNLIANQCIEVIVNSPTITPGQEARKCLSEGDYNCAIEKYKLAAETAAENSKKAEYYLVVAKIYYSHLKNFPQSRSFARKAAGLKGNWGEPYILIGKLYASSGPLCGSGRGWNSQVVTWPAIDKWQYAKSIDPSVAAQANKLINTYKKYMPSIEDVFLRNKKRGDTYKVECWIQENTVIRTAD